ncbi:putative integral membrane protein [Diaporthe ampelina]|uniref:Putative integral membrane protein n=1 Tax=Diaporthe ampelina TaxID=1214573 RepID=A0A0G2I9G9_9PEZI|nr:putative integral membrane protein [Diaporthe ampelina]
MNKNRHLPIPKLRCRGHSQETMRLLSCVAALVTVCAATFVPAQRCDNGRQPGAGTLLPKTAVRVKLEPGNGTDVRLALDTVTLLDQEGCARWARELTRGTIEIEAMGRPTLYAQLNISGCRTSPYREGEVSLYVSYAQHMHAFPAVSTMKTTVRLYDANSDERGCLRSHITPALPPPWSSTLRYFPLGIFLFVLVVGAARSLVNLPRPDDDEDTVPRLGNGDGEEGEDAPDPQPVLPNVGDCLQYLQHIFLGASLSLFYPGFLIPVAGRLSWSSLFSGGILTYGHADYASIADGIYERNGTYGGTFGLETMAQIVGAPATMGTWLNMVFLFTIFLIVSAVLIEAFWLFQRVLQVALSYFIVPLISLSVYQLIQASWLPLYHTALAALLIFTAIASLTWLFQSLPTRSLGVLLFNRDKQYSRMNDSGHQADALFVRMLFTLNFIRGITIGGLQSSGLAQLVTLAACEVIMIICIAALQVFSTFSLGTITSVARLFVLLAMVAFIPGVASDETRNVVGYIILLLHACILVLGFLLQGSWDLVQLIKRWHGQERPDINFPHQFHPLLGDSGIRYQ